MATDTRWQRRVVGDDRVAGGGGLVSARRLRRRGRLRLVAVGVVLVGLAVAVFAVLVPQAPHTRAVLVAARPVRAGQTFAVGDVRVAQLASSDVVGVGVADRARVVGRVAALDVAAGQPLVMADVGGVPGPGPGEAIVGVALAPGRLPDGLSAGDSVAVVGTPAPGGVGSVPAGSAAVVGSGELARGRVFVVGTSPDGSRVDVSLVVPAGLADGVAAAAAGGGVSVVWVAR